MQTCPTQATTSLKHACCCEERLFPSLRSKTCPRHSGKRPFFNMSEVNLLWQQSFTYSEGNGALLQTCSCLISSLNALNRSFVPDSFRSSHVANLGPKNSLHAGLLQSCCAFPTGFKGFSHPFHFSLVALMGLGLVLVCWASQGPSAPLSVQVCIHLVPCVGPDCFLAFFFVSPILVSPGMNLT